MTKQFGSVLPAAALALALVLCLSGEGLAHCDGLDGPVVMAAKKALETSDVNLVLIWVQPDDEAEIREAFEKTLAVRRLGDDARAMADMYFFETLVRIHRAGEGAPYTGLKPAGRDLGPALPAADKALEDGALEPVVELLTEHVHHGMQAHFEAARAKMNYAKEDVAAGREYVEAHVQYIHYVEGLYEAAVATAEGHFHEAEAAVEHH